ncbi:N-acetyltransferase [Acutalibacter sp. 1XD8-33]|uniref:GNAT family N-acetyltransferase n=1 Tax=Acutalibacter sp. 1XD8-33 TaxID=2320081 RepID=UPI000EA34E44|nr:GNAT family N-acetyltransferase [Acutalibacter sp. 1XD8-33]RKJ40692.1 N-acetyltransferase [Acutalibacter sp. 1XD8-33]
MDIKALVPGMAGEFFRYFEESAFLPGDPRANCYCLESHLSDEARYVEVFERRWAAKQLIDSGRMTGYLLYDGERPVGWCNGGDKMDYRPIRENPAFFTGGQGRGRIRILYCLDIAEGYQGKGLAGLVMERFLMDAEAQGYRWAEGYPFVNRDYPWQYRGPVGLYEKFGFTRFQERPGFYVYRKELGRREGDAE